MPEPNDAFVLACATKSTASTWCSIPMVTTSTGSPPAPPMRMNFPPSCRANPAVLAQAVAVNSNPPTKLRNVPIEASSLPLQTRLRWRSSDHYPQLQHHHHPYPYHHHSFDRSHVRSFDPMWRSNDQLSDVATESVDWRTVEQQRLFSKRPQRES